MALSVFLPVFTRPCFQVCFFDQIPARRFIGWQSIALYISPYSTLTYAQIIGCLSDRKITCWRFRFSSEFFPRIRGHKLIISCFPVVCPLVCPGMPVLLSSLKKRPKRRYFGFIKPLYAYLIRKERIIIYYAKRDKKTPGKGNPAPAISGVEKI